MVSIMLLFTRPSEQTSKHTTHSSNQGREIDAAGESRSSSSGDVSVDAAKTGGVFVTPFVDKLEMKRCINTAERDWDVFKFAAQTLQQTPGFA